MSALAGTCRRLVPPRRDLVSAQLHLRASDLAASLAPGQAVLEWPNRGTSGPRQNAVPVLSTPPTFVASKGGAVRFVGNDELRLANLFDDAAEQVYYGRTPKLLSVVFSSSTYRTVAAYGAQGFIELVTSFAYVPGRVIEPPPPASTTPVVLSVWVFPNTAYASGLGIQVFMNEQASAVDEFTASQQQADFFIGRGWSGQVPDTGLVDVHALRGHFRVVDASERASLHTGLMQTYL